MIARGTLLINKKYVDKIKDDFGYNDYEINENQAIFKISNYKHFELHEEIKERLNAAHVIRSKSNESSNAMKLCWRPNHDCDEDVPVIADSLGRITFGPLKQANIFTRELHQVIAEIDS